MGDGKFRFIVKLTKEATGQFFGEVDVSALVKDMSPIIGPYADDKRRAVARALKRAAQVMEEFA